MSVDATLGFYVNDPLDNLVQKVDGISILDDGYRFTGTDTSTDVKKDITITGPSSSGFRNFDITWPSNIPSTSQVLSVLSSTYNSTTEVQEVELSWGTDVNLFVEDTAGSSIIDHNIYGGTGAGAAVTAGGGTENFFAGVNAGNAVTTGSSNIAIGNTALATATTQSDNVAVGVGALTVASNTNSQNVGIGSGALGTLTGAAGVSANNVAVGHNAVNTVTETSLNQSIYIGAETKASGSTATNEIAIGYGATGKGNNTVLLGNSSATDVYVGQSNSTNLVLTGNSFTTKIRGSTVATDNVEWILPTTIPSSGDFLGATVAGAIATLSWQSISTTTDPLIYLASSNTGDTYDIGFYGKYVNAGTKYTGFFRDATDGNFKLFAGLPTAPTATSVGDVSAYYANMDCNAITLTSLTDGTATLTGGALTGATQITVDQLDLNGSNITYSGATETNLITVPDNLASAFLITDGTQNYIQLVSTTGLDEVQLLQNTNVTGTLSCDTSFTIDAVSVTASNLTSLLAMITAGVQNLTASEVTQLTNIDLVTITNTQWGYLGAMNQGVSTADSVSFTSITDGTATLTGGALTGLTSLGVGTATVPYAGVGMAKVAVVGTDSSTAGPHMQFNTSIDNYPLLQFANWTHDNVNISFDCYQTAVSSWLSSDAGSNFVIRKTTDTLRFQYDSGIAVGLAVTLNDGIILDTSGNVNIPGLTASRVVSTDASKNLVSSSFASWITGTANQIIVTDDGDGTITLSTPQNIDISANVQFGTLSLGSAGSVALWNDATVTGSGNLFNTISYGKISHTGTPGTDYATGHNFACDSAVATGFTISTLKTVNIAAPTKSGLGNSPTVAYSLYVNDPTAATTNVCAYFDGNVGIGNTQPSSKLHLYNSGATSTHLTVGNGSITSQFGVTSSGSYIGTTTISDLNLFTTNLTRLTVTSGGSIGVGTSTAPHAGIGLAKFAIDGQDSSSIGPHVQITTDLDNYPLMQLFNWRHDYMAITFDCYSTGPSFASSDIGSNFLIRKSSDLFQILYDSGIVAGSTITPENGIILNTSGNVAIGTSPGSTYKLQLYNAGTANTYLSVGNASLSLICGAFAATSGYMGTSTNHDLAIITNNVTRINIASTGAVDVNSTLSCDTSFTIDAVSITASNLTSLLAMITAGVQNLTASEVIQLTNIDLVTITNTQWGYLGAMDQGVATTDSVSFTSITDGTATLTGGALTGLTSLGVGTATVPYAGVGMAKVAVVGTDSSTAGPHMQFNTSIDNYPLTQFANWTHDNVSISFDCYQTAVSSWLSSDAGSNFVIRKTTDTLRFQYDSGITAGLAVTLNDGIVLDTSGNVNIPSLTALRLVSTDASKNLISSDFVSWVAGTANQIIVTDDGDGTITLSTPQNIDTSANVQFGTLSLGSAGSVALWNNATVTGSGDVYNTISNGKTSHTGTPGTDYATGHYFACDSAVATGFTVSILRTVNIAAPTKSGLGNSPTTAYSLYVSNPTVATTNVCAYFDGNVGIGTNPDTKFHVQVSDASAGVSALAVAHFEKNDDSAIQITAGINKLSYILFADPASSSPGQIYYDHSADALTLLTNGSVNNVIRLDSGGGVGIGGTSDSGIAMTIQTFAGGGGYTIQKITDGLISSYLYSSSTSSGFGWVGTQTTHPFLIGTGNATRITIDTSGNVGIGATPDYKFCVASSSTDYAVISLGDQSGANLANASVLFRDQGTANGAIRYDTSGATATLVLEDASSGGSSPTGWYSGTAMNMVVRNGNVGIGGTPAEALTITWPSGNNGIALNAPSSLEQAYIIFVSGSTPKFQLGKGVADYFFIYDVTNAKDCFRIETGTVKIQPSVGNLTLCETSTGSVSIGTTTTPGANTRLQVERNANADYYNMVQIRNTDTGSSVAAGLTISAGSAEIGQIFCYNAAHATYPSSMAVINEQAGPLRLGTSNVERMRIDSAGYVGIGVTPTSRLHVYSLSDTVAYISRVGGTHVGTNDASTMASFLVDTALSPTYAGTKGLGISQWLYPNFNPSSSTTITSAIALFIDTLIKGATGTITNAYGLYVNAPTGGSNNYCAYLAGPVGIGTTTPGYKLDLSGTGATLQRIVGSNADGPVIRFENTAASGIIYHVGSTDNTSGAGNGFSVYDITAGARRFLIDPNGHVFIPGIQAGAGTYPVYWNSGTGELTYNTSSRRFKTDIQALGLSESQKILNVEAKTYIHLADTVHDVGLIAEDFDDAGMNNLVIYDEEKRPSGIRYDRVACYLLEVIKNQATEIQSLTTQVTNQATEIQNLTTQMTDVLARLQALEAI